MRLPYSKIIFLPSIRSSSIIKCTRLHRWVSVGQGIIVWGKCHCQGLSWKYTRPLISLLSSQCTNKGKKVEGYLVSSFREKKGEVSITGYVEQMELEKNKFQLCFNISPNTYHKGSRGFWSFEVFLELQSVLKTWLFLRVNTVISA